MFCKCVAPCRELRHDASVDAVRSNSEASTASEDSVCSSAVSDDGVSWGSSLSGSDTTDTDTDASDADAASFIASCLDSFAVHLLMVVFGVCASALLVLGVLRDQVHFVYLIHHRVGLWATLAYSILLSFHAVGRLVVFGWRAWLAKRLARLELVLLFVQTGLCFMMMLLATERSDKQLMLLDVLSIILVLGPVVLLQVFRLSRKWARSKVSQRRRRLNEDGFDLDLTYITPRIIAMSFPAGIGENMLRNSMAEVQRLLNTRHAGQYKVYNLCAEKSKHYDRHAFHLVSEDVTMLDHNPCPLADLCKLIDDQHSFLMQSKSNVVVIHCKAGKGRTGFVVACLLLREGLASSAAEALAMYAERRTYDCEGVTIASQIRYVGLYERVLREGVIQHRPLQLLEVRLEDLPADHGLGAKPFATVWWIGADAELESETGAVQLVPSQPSRGSERLETNVIDLRSLDLPSGLLGDFKISVWFVRERCIGCCEKKRRAFSFWLHTGYTPLSLELSHGDLDYVKKAYRRILSTDIRVKCNFQNAT